MRDPMSWSVPLFRVFGIPIRLHLLFIVVALGMFLRQVLSRDNPVWWADVLLLAVVLPFAIVLLHEFGHCFAARAVGGEAKEILIWPLGGLASNEVPNTPRAHLLTAAAGPGVNLALCVMCAMMLSAGGFFPTLNPLANLYRGEMYNYRNGRIYTSEYGLKVYKPGTAELVPLLSDYEAFTRKDEGLRERTVYKPETADAMARQLGGERALAPAWAVWMNRTFWLSWLLLLFNLIPAYPLDGGQILQSLIWARTDYRRGVVVASYSGFVTGVVFLIISIAADESLFLGLALFIMYMASTKLYTLETEETPFGYDFSAGYTSLDRDDEPVPRPKRPGAVARWWLARKARKIQREIEQRAADEEHKEQLLEKIAQSGMNSLTAEERRFLEQFSARYRHRS